MGKRPTLPYLELWDLKLHDFVFLPDHLLFGKSMMPFVSLFGVD